MSRSTPSTCSLVCPEPQLLPVKSFMWLVECLPGLPPLCWSMIPTARPPQPLERPLHVVEATGTVRLWLQIQLPLQKQCCSQAPLQLLGACCTLRSAGWVSSCIRRSSEFKWFRHQLSANMDLSPGTPSALLCWGTALQGCTWGHCRVHRFFFPPARLSTLQLSKVMSHLPQIKKSGYSRAMVGFGFVSRAGPLVIHSVCCLC